MLIHKKNHITNYAKKNKQQSPNVRMPVESDINYFADYRCRAMYDCPPPP